MEARAGEHKVALHDSEGAKQFQALLRKTGKEGAKHAPANTPEPPVAQTERAKDDASDRFPMPQVAPTKQGAGSLFSLFHT
jgi:hypothetical protein